MRMLKFHSILNLSSKQVRRFKGNSIKSEHWYDWCKLFPLILRGVFIEYQFQDNKSEWLTAAIVNTAYDQTNIQSFAMESKECHKNCCKKNRIVKLLFANVRIQLVYREKRLNHFKNQLHRSFALVICLSRNNFIYYSHQ